MGGVALWHLAGFLMSLGGAVVCAIVTVVLLNRSTAPRREHGAVVAALGLSAAWCVTNAAWGP